MVPLSWRACPIPTLPCSLIKTGRSVPARCTLTALPMPAGTPQHCPKLAGSLPVQCSPFALPKSVGVCHSHRDRLQLCHTSRSHRGALRACRPRYVSFTHSHYSLLVPSRMELIYTNFCNCFPGDTCRSPGLEASRFYNCSSSGLYTVYLYMLKAAAEGCGFQSAWNWVLNEIPPFVTLAEHGKSSKLGPIKFKLGCLDNHNSSRDNQELGPGWK